MFSIKLEDVIILIQLKTKNVFKIELINTIIKTILFKNKFFFKKDDNNSGSPTTLIINSKNNKYISFYLTSSEIGIAKYKLFHSLIDISSYRVAVLILLNGAFLNFSPKL